MKRRPSFLHLTDHCLAAVAINTTGPNVEEDTIYEIGIVPVDNFIEPIKDVTWLDLIIKPDDDSIPYSGRRNLRKRYEAAKVHGIPERSAYDFLYEWVKERGYKKGVAPISHDYCSTGAFLRSWCGHVTYKKLFDEIELRDLRVMARTRNDVDSFRFQTLLYNNCHLGNLARKTKIDRGHYDGSALNRAKIIADIYKGMILEARRQMVSY